MPIIPSNKGLPQSAINQAKESIETVLVNHIKGKNAAERIERATADIIGAISHMLTIREVRESKLGATVMTESASHKPSKINKPRTM